MWYNILETLGNSSIKCDKKNIFYFTARADKQIPRMEQILLP